MKRWFVLLIAALCLGVASAGRAQIATATSTEPSPMQQGGVLPGATVSVVAKSIGGAPRTTVTDTGGSVPFPQPRQRYLHRDGRTARFHQTGAGRHRQHWRQRRIPFSLTVGGLSET